jgi:hypothetical protein
MRGNKTIKTIYRFIDTKNFRLIFFAFIVGIVVGLVTSFFRLILEKIEVIKEYWYIFTYAYSWCYFRNVVWKLC